MLTVHAQREAPVFKKSFKAGVFALLMASVGMAHAESVTLRYDGFQYGSNTGTLTRPGASTVSSAIGGFDMNVIGNVAGGLTTFSDKNSTYSTSSSSPSILAWCVDIYHSLDTQNNTVYSVKSATDLTADFNARRVDNLQALFNQHYKDVLTASSATAAKVSAAMQLAIWEILFETSSTFDLDNGGFKVTGSGSAAARTLAESWLAGLDTNAPDQYRIVYLKDVNAPLAQNLISVSAVPLPGAALMFLSALGLGGWARRRSITA